MRAWALEASQKAERYQLMAAEVEQVQQTARTRDGAVSVTVAASGAVTDLVLGELVRQWDPERTAAEVLRCMRQAQSQLAAGVQEVVSATIGSDEVTAGAVVDGYATRFPPPPPEPPAPGGPRELAVPAPDDDREPPRPPARPTRRDEPDDDFFGGGVLR